MKNLQNHQNKPLRSRKLISIAKNFIHSNTQVVLFLTCLWILIFSSSSCSSKKKLSYLNSLAEENKILKAKLDSEISKSKEGLFTKASKKEIDSYSEKMFIFFLDSIAKKANLNDQEPDNLNYKQKTIFADKLKQQIVLNLEHVSILNELLNTNTYVRFNTGALFKPGGYLIEDDQWKSAIKAFSPVMDSLLSFTSHFPKKEFEATIIIVGYSDATPIGKSGQLYSILTEKLNAPDADKSTLNLELSKMRAASVLNVFEDLSAIKICKSDLKDKINLNLLSFGKGEELPDPSMKNVTEDDERRRSVIAYWSVLPK